MLTGLAVLYVLIFVLILLLTLIGGVEPTFSGKKIHNPVLKLLSLFYISLWLTLALVMTPILIPSHYLLRRLGRNGFYFNNKVIIGRTSFEKRNSNLF